MAYVKRTNRGPYNGGVRKRGSSPARVCAHCGKTFYRVPSKPGLYCGSACVIAAGAHIHSTPPEERYWPKVAKEDDADADIPELLPCWTWTAGVDGHGYGAFTLKPGKQIGAHVYAYELASGAPVPDGMLVLHTCDVPTCVRNDPPGTYMLDGVARPCFGHLWVGTYQDNAIDSAIKGRHRFGPESGMLKLTPEVRAEIRARRANGEGLGSLAAHFGITREAVYEALIGPDDQ